MKKATALATALLAAALLAACNDDPSDPPADTAVQPEVIPASATASTAAYVSYTGGLVASDATEPVDIAAAVPPTSETEEPLPVN